jgi:hypothetical protein
MSRFIWRRNKAPARKTPQRVRLQLEALEDRMVPAVFNVGAGDVATLIADINTANSNGQSNTINLTASTYDFTSANNNTFGPNALPVITGNITINGNGAVLMRDPSLGQNTPFRFFYVSGSQVASPSGPQSTGSATGTLVLNDLTLEDGLAQGGSSGTGGGGMGAGGAIFNMGNLTLNGVTLAQNTAEGGNSGTGASSSSGGGLGGPNATTVGNFGVGGAASDSGGFGGGGGVNGAGGFGAGNGNGSSGGGGLGAGGALFNMYGTTTLINCTLASNLAEGGQGATTGDGYGGAIFNVDGTLNVTTSTLANNSTTGAANGGGAVYNLSLGTSSGSGAASTVTLTDSILADSIGSNDLVNDENSSTPGAAVVNATAPNIVMASSTLDGATTNGTPLTANPQLGVLANYGGQTPTMALLSGSPALGAGTSGSNVPTTDQRGVARGSVIDLGAYQSTSASAVATTLTLTSSTPAASSGASVVLTATVAASSGSTTPAGSVQFVDATTGTVLGSAALSGGTATLTTTSVSSGDKITASYSSSNGMGNSYAVTTVPTASTSSSSSSNSGSSSSGSPVMVSAQNQAWLNAVYEKLLGRPIDATGLKEWGADLNNGMTPTQVVLDIEQTTEYRTDEILGAYQQLLGLSAQQVPSSAVSYLLGLMQAGADFRVVQAIIAGSDYSSTNDQFLNNVYEEFLQRPVDQNSETAWGALLTAGYSRIAVVYGILSSPEYLNDLVTQDYMTYMGVTPDQASLGAYVAALENHTMNNDMVVASLLGSQEWISLNSSTPSSSS